MFLFLALGAATYLVSPLWRDDPVSTPSPITVSKSQLELLRHNDRRQYGRWPTEAEFTAAVAALLDEEILIQQGEHLGLVQRDPVIQQRMAQNKTFLADGDGQDSAGQADLDAKLWRNDALIRQRVVQQVQFHLQNTIPLLKPDDRILQDYMERNAADYRIPVRTSLRQVYFNHRLRGAGLDSDIEQAKVRLLESADVELNGDAIPLPARIEDASTQVIARRFGKNFAQALEALAEGIWHGPVESAYGSHLVLVEQRSAAHLPPLATIRKQVYLSWVAQQRQTILAEAMQSLRDQYTVAYDGLNTVAAHQFPQLAASLLE